MIFILKVTIFLHTLVSIHLNQTRPYPVLLEKNQYTFLCQTQSTTDHSGYSFRNFAYILLLLNPHALFCVTV